MLEGARLGMRPGATQTARGKTTRVVSLAAVVIAISGLLYGYNATVIAGAILFIKFEFSLIHFAEETIIGASLVGIYMSANMLGVVCGYLVELVFDTSGNWRWMLGFPALIALPFAIGVWMLPETPRWCLCHNRPDPARDALKRIRGRENVEEEMHQITASLSKQH